MGENLVRRNRCLPCNERICFGTNLAHTENLSCIVLITKGMSWWTWRESIFRAICGICKLLNLKDVRCAECAYLAGSGYNLDTFLLKAFQKFCQFAFVGLCVTTYVLSVL